MEDEAQQDRAPRPAREPVAHEEEEETVQGPMMEDLATVVAQAVAQVMTQNQPAPQ